MDKWWFGYVLLHLQFVQQPQTVHVYLHLPPVTEVNNYGATKCRGASLIHRRLCLIANPDRVVTPSSRYTAVRTPGSNITIPSLLRSNMSNKSGMLIRKSNNVLSCLRFRRPRSSCSLGIPLSRDAAAAALPGGLV